MSKTALKQHEDDRNKLLQQEAEITREVQQLTERRTALSQSLEAGRTEFESLKTSQEVTQLEVRAWAGPLTQLPIALFVGAGGCC